jgi:cytochrome c oxidase assembly protein subunit 15
MSLDTTNSSATPALHRYAIVCVGATLGLIFIGGLVTSTGSALAVPDWPLAFGHLIPKLEGGVRFEYGHRVAAGLVSLLTLGLALWMRRAERRGWVRKLAVGAFGLVIVQALLGGITVLLQLPLLIAVTHAATAQAFFCVIVTLAAVTNPQFGAASDDPSFAPSSGLGRLAALTTATIYLQILIGAVMRHLGAGLAIPDFPLSYGRLIPPLESGFVMINFAHRCGALIVAILIATTAARVLRSAPRDPWLMRPAWGLLALLVLQITLGAMTIRSRRAVLPTTAHVATGATVLATSLLLTIRLYAAGASLARSETARLRELRPSLAGRGGGRVCEARPNNGARA